MIKYALLSEIGERKKNEDCIAECSGENGHLFVLCDGLGGHGSGEIASKTAIEAVKSTFLKEVLEPRELLRRCVEKAQRELYAIQSKMQRHDSCKTTITLLLIKDNVATYAHVGDSRVYVFQRNKLVERTLDHSVPQMLVMQGEIKEREIRFHEDRNRLIRVLGNDIEPPNLSISNEFSSEVDTQFLLCSDGFWEWIDEKEMIWHLRWSKSAQQWIDRMKAVVEKRGKGKHMDNFSAIAVFVQNK